jgi:hypothetical protein
MPSVPYRPYPTQTPSVEPTPAMGIRVPTAAFGSSVAEGTQKLGSTIESVGDMLHKQVMEQQALENDTWVKNAFIASESAIGEKTAAYKETEGVDAANARPQYVKDIQDIRQKALDDAPNPMAKKALDDQLSRRIGFNLIDAAGHSATQAKHANDEASKTLLTRAMETYDPSAPDATERMAEVRKRTLDYWATKGVSRQTAEIKADENEQHAMVNGVVKASGAYPNAALELWQKVRDRITIPNLRNAAEAKINSNVLSHGVTTNAQKMLDGEEVGKSGISIGNKYNPETDRGKRDSIRMAAEEAGEELGKGVPGYKEAFVQTVMSQVNQRDADFNHVKAARMEDMRSFTSGHGDPTKRITSEAGIWADPKYSKIWATMNDNEKNTIRNQIATANKGAQPSMTDPGVLEHVQTWESIANDAKKGSAPAKKRLDEADILNDPLLPPKVKDELMKIKIHQAGADESDRQFEIYVNESRALLNKFGMGRGSATDTVQADKFYRFKGAFKAEIQAYEEQNGGKRPPVKEREAMIQRLIKDQIKIPGRGLFHGFGLIDSSDARYKVYSDERPKIIEGFKTHNGREPTETEIQRLFNAQFPVVH